MASSSGFVFRHRGADNSGQGTSRRELTSTGRMLSAPFTPAESSRPQPPPPTFKDKEQITYHTSNPFSSHDNRNTIQDRGEYFGDGKDSRTLGRKLLQPRNSRLHHTEHDFLKHYSRNPVEYNYNTEFATSYTGTPATTANDSGLSSARRFPRTRPEPPSGPVPLSTSTTAWLPPAEAQKSTCPSTRVLAISQQPYPKHNSWRYSYKGLHKVYPPYGDPIRLPAVDNVFNRYGAAFNTAAGAES